MSLPSKYHYEPCYRDLGLKIRKVKLLVRGFYCSKGVVGGGSEIMCFKNASLSLWSMCFSIL